MELEKLTKDEAVSAMRIEEVKAIREELGLTQEMLAEEIKVSRGTITRWESGAVWITPSNLDHLRRVVAVHRLRVDLLYLAERATFVPLVR